MNQKPAWRDLGPGIVIAATGVGAGDLIAAAVGGARYGTLILWAALAGALFKWALNEGLARWQLATGETLLEGWVHKLPRLVSDYFLIYLILWSFVVAGALMSACGLAAHALVPAVSVPIWGALHSLAAAGLVLWGGYRYLELMMKLFIGMMFTVIMTCAVLTAPPLSELVSGLLIPRIPEGSMPFVMGVIGGVGGSVTLLSYGYWIRERGWNRVGDLTRVRLDLTVAYVLTGLFGIAIMVVSAGVKPDVMSGSKMVIGVANHLGDLTGPAGQWLFLLGFWGAVFSSMLGVWQGIPYLFCDFVNTRAGVMEINTESRSYRGFLTFLALPPMILLLVDKPVWVVLIYAVTGAFFMPFLAALLLYMNRSKWLGSHGNGWRSNLLLLLALLLFGALLAMELVKRFGA